MLDVFIQRVARARDLDTPTKLAHALEQAGHRTSVQTVCWWWNGTTKRLDDGKARALIGLLKLTPEEVDELVRLQSGLTDTEAA